MSVKIGVIVSTTRPTRAGRKIADWFMKQVADVDGVQFELLDLAEINLPFMDEPNSPMSGEYIHEHTKQWSKTIQALDGYVFVTAEYNNAPPAPLKNAIDMLYHEWDKKPVAFVGYGTYGATRAVEQLVDITAKVGLVPLTKTFVGIVKPWEAVQDDGSISPEHLNGNLDTLVSNLQWWAALLKSARKPA